MITSDPKILNGKPHIDGTRIAVQFVTNLLADGVSPEEIIRGWYPHLTIEQIEECRRYKQETP